MGCHLKAVFCPSGIHHANGSCSGVYVCSSVCLSVCLSAFPHDVSKTDAAKITTKLDTEMFHDESWNLIYFGVKRSKVKVTRHTSVFIRNAISKLAV